MSKLSKTEVVTSHGVIAVEENSAHGPKVLFLHGNSTCRAVFRKQFMDDILGSYHLIALDLPGHGESGDAVDPKRTYSRPGLADACLEVMAAMGIRSAVIVGWSLGGHIAIEMLSRSAGIDGIMVTGTPPVGDNITEGFRRRPLGGLAGEAELTSEEAVEFAHAIMGPHLEPFIPNTIRRTDKHFRPLLVSGAMKGQGANQRDVLSATSVPTAIVNGALDDIVNLDYVKSVPYGNLWNDTCIRIPRASHAPFWEVPASFNALLRNFLDDVHQ